MVHELKCQTEFFEALFDKSKLFEIRFDDRGYEVGDVLVLKEWTGTEFTGRDVIKCVTYVLRDFPGLVKGWVAMSFEVLLP